MVSNSTKVTLDVAVQTQQEQIDELEARMRQLQQEKLQVKIETQSEELTRVTQEIEDTKNELNRLQGKVEIDNSEIESLESELNETLEVLDSIEGVVAIDDSQVEEVRNHADELQSQIEELQANISVDTTEMDELESKLTDLESTQLDLQIQCNKDEIDAAKVSMDDLKSSTDDASNSTDNLNSSLGLLDTMAVFSISEALAGYGGEAEQMAQDMNNAAISVGQLATQTGIAEPQMVSLINHISNATFPNEEAMMYVKSLDQIGVSAGNLGKSATDLDKINDAFGLGADKVNSLGQELSVLGVDMNDVSSSFNALAYANANTVGGMDNYYNFLRRYDAQFKELGYNVDQASIIIAGATQKFGGGRAALSGLSDALKEANGDSRKLEEALGLQAGALDNASQITGQYEGQLQKLADEEAEHKTWIDQLNAAWEDISLSLSPVLSPMASFMGLIGQAGSWAVGVNGMWELGNKLRELSIVDTIGGKFNGFKDKIRTLSTTASNTAKSIGTSLVNAIKTVGSAAKTAAVEMGKFTVKIIKAGAEAVISAGKWLIAKGALVAERIATMAAAGAQAFLNFVMSMNPIVLVVTAIIALIAVLGYLYFTNEDVRNAINGLGESLVGLGETIYGSLQGALEWLQGAWQNTVDWFTNGAQSISDTVTGAFQWLTDSFNQVVSFFQTYGPLIAQILFVMATGGIGAIILLVANFLGMPNQVGQALQNVISRVVSFVSSLVSNFLNGARNSVNNFMGQIRSLPGQFKAELQRMLSAVNEWAATLPAKFWEAGVNAVKNFLNALGIHSPGFMAVNFGEEIERLEKSASDNSVADKIGGTARDIMSAWGNPELDYYLNQILDKHTDDDSKNDNQSMIELLRVIIDILRNLPKPEGGSFTFNHYGDTDSEQRMERILEAVRRDFYWNNEKAGRNTEELYGA